MPPIDIPSHLRRFVVEQDYGQYTAIHQASWRFLLRQLRHYLAQHAHESYVDGLERTGITIEQIPRIEDISACLEYYGWRAVGVSGFIPPAAFMELQAMGILPVGTVMRTLEHLLYTPAPDIVHEAAGHAPILIHPEFSQYLHKYAHAARKAIFSKEDLDLYEAIRILSDVKEHPGSTATEIAQAEQRLQEAVANVGEPSEANLLGRLNWWTAEYGLFGTLDDPKIYGAGLLSSLGESHWCMRAAVKKLPQTLACIDYAYDITEPQPQLFVTPDFATLNRIIDELAVTMAFRRGGVFGLARIKDARTVNTIQYNSGLQVSGRLVDFILDPATRDAPVESQRAVYVRFAGPVQLAYRDKELSGHGTDYHVDGFGAPVGLLRGQHRCLAEWRAEELARHGIVVGKPVTLEFASGVRVQGTLKAMVRNDALTQLMTFTHCTVTYRDQVLFDPAWGEYDMAVGSTLPTVYGGAADREAYGELEAFAVKHVPPVTLTAQEEALVGLYATIRELRQCQAAEEILHDEIPVILDALERAHPDDWLLPLEIYELARTCATPPPWQARARRRLDQRMAANDELSQFIRVGIELADMVGRTTPLSP